MEEKYLGGEVNGKAAISQTVKRRARAGSGVKLSFYIHLFFYVAVNALLFLINAMTTPLFWWVAWSVLGWGFALLIHALVAFMLPDVFGLRRRLYEKELARQTER